LILELVNLFLPLPQHGTSVHGYFASFKLAFGHSFLKNPDFIVLALEVPLIVLDSALIVLFDAETAGEGGLGNRGSRWRLLRPI
jgi:hypothetical protein